MKGKNKQKASLMALMLATSLSLNACGGSQSNNYASDSTAGSASFAPASMNSFGGPKSSASSDFVADLEAALKNERTEETEDAVEGDAGSTQIEKKIIRNVEVSVISDNIDILRNSMTSLKTLVEGLGGYTLGSSADFGTYRTSGELYFKIPKDKVDGFIASVEASGLKIQSLDDSSTDKTTEYVDIDARLKVKEIQKAKYEEYLKKAETVEDLLAVENELNNLIEEIEASKSRLQAIDLDVDMTNVKVYLTCNEQLERESFGGRLVSGLKEAGNNLLDAFLNVLDGLSYLIIPLVVYFGIFLVLASIFVKTVRKAWGKRASKDNKLDKKKDLFKRMFSRDKDTNLEKHDSLEKDSSLEKS